jgi:NADH-quinone oxidoreductase subunit C
LTAEEIHGRLRERFGDDVVTGLVLTDESDPKSPVIYDPPQSMVDAPAIAEVAMFCRDEDALRLDSLMCLSALDRGSNLSVVYNLHSMTHRHVAALRVDVPRAAAVVPSVERAWKTANWHEREAHDLMGIAFSGHSDLRPLILPEGWEGYPLRKDYEVQEYYRGMKVPY